MHELGAWIINTPASRAFFNTSFNRGANSLSRTTAFLLECESHMSQTIKAECEADQDSWAMRLAPLGDRDCKVIFRVSSARIEAQSPSCKTKAKQRNGDFINARSESKSSRRFFNPAFCKAHEPCPRSDPPRSPPIQPQLRIRPL